MRLDVVFIRIHVRTHLHSLSTDMHLTNVAIQKTAEGYQKKRGCKLGLSKIKLLLASKHGMPAADKLMSDMQAS
jgi:hypothetical protein